ncbi:MAG: LuxR C-terminal-related transcriptional regulator [Limnohabitans sp.]
MSESLSTQAAASHFWVCPPRGAHALELPLTQVTGLLEKIGLSDRHAVAEEVLRLLGPLVPLAQCTIFSFEGTGRPRTVAVGDRSRTRELPDISQAYVQRFYRLDGALQAMQAHEAAARKALPGRPHIVLHRQAACDVQHPDYRQTCYTLPQVAERLAVLSLHEGRRWLSVNLYRGTEHGPLSERDIARVEALAPLIVQAVRLHYTGQVLSSDLMGLMMDRLALRGPALTARDEDVVRGLLQGLQAHALAERLGLTPASAQTYTKRLYRKLGVSGHKALVAWLLGDETREGSASDLI